MPTRYADEPEYGREATRGIRRERDGRDVRERVSVRDEPRESRRTMEVEQPRMPARGAMVEPDLIRGESQRIANSGVPRQQDSRSARTAPTRDRGDDDMMYDAPPRTQYTSVREQREPARRTPYEGEFDDMPAQIRPVIDPGRSRDEPRPNYNEYFLPGDGIDREVIQSEICRYLGQDATCKPGTHNDGRRGYIIRAYRALTTEMIRSLKEDSAKYARERENAVRRSRAPPSYAAVRDMARYGGADVEMMDEPEEPRYASRYEEPQPRLRNPAVTSTYMADAGYPAYYPVTNQPPPPGVDTRMDPRYVPGNTTPPSGRTPGYPPQGYPAVTTRPSVPSIPAGGAYADPRTGVVRDPGYGTYASEPTRRHR